MKRSSNLPKPRRWHSQSYPEFRTPKVFYPIAQGRAAHPGDRPHAHPLRTPKVFYKGSWQARSERKQAPYRALHQTPYWSIVVKPFQSTGPIKRTLTASTHCQAVKRTAFLTKPPTQTRLGRPSETRQPIKAQNPSPHQNSVDGLLSQVHSLECEWRQLLEMENANKHLSTRIN